MSVLGSGPTVFPHRARYRGPGESLAINTFRNQMLYDLSRLDKGTQSLKESIQQSYEGAWYSGQDVASDIPLQGAIGSDDVSFEPMLSLHRKMRDLEERIRALNAAIL